MQSMNNNSNQAVSKAPAQMPHPKYNVPVKKTHAAKHLMEHGHGERKFFDSADWAMNGKIAGKPATQEEHLPHPMSSGAPVN